MTENKKKRCIWLYFVAFAIPVLTMLAHMFLTNCYPFGGNTILIRDADSQYVPFLNYMVEKIKSGGSLQFDWHSGLGNDYYATFFYYLASPFNLLMFLFGASHMEIGALVIFLVQIGGCGVTALYFFRHTKYNRLTTGKNMMSLLFAMAYVMCDYILAYQYNFIWLISLMLTPLVLLGIEYMVDRRDYRLYFVSLLLTLITNFYFAWYVCIFAVIYFIDQHYDGAKDFFKKFLKFVCASVVAALCAAVVLIPCYLTVFNRDVDSDWYTLDMLGYGYFGNVSDFFSGFYFAHKIDSFGYELFVNNNYCGVFTIVLILLFVFNKNVDRKHRVKRSIELIVIGIAFNWIVTSYIFQGFTIPHCYISRFMFILIMMLLIMALESLNGIEQIRYRYILAAAILGVVLFAAGLIEASEAVSIMGAFLTILLGTYYLICLILLKRKSIKKISLYVNIFLLGLIELMCNAIMCSADEHEYSSWRETNYKAWKSLYYDLDTDETERKASWIGDKNAAYCSDGSIFSSIINSGVLKLYKNLGLSYQKNGGVYAYHGTTPISMSLFNTNRVLTDTPQAFGGYRLDYKLGMYDILEPEHELSLGYVMPETFLDWNSDMVGQIVDGKLITPMDVQNDLTDNVMNIGKAFEEYCPDNIDISTSGCMALGRKKRITDIALPEQLKKREGIWYRNLYMGDDNGSVISMQFTVQDEGDVYAYICDSDNALTYNVWVDGNLISQDLYKSCAGTVHIGELTKGQRVQINVGIASAILSYGVCNVKLYTIDNDVVDRYYEAINRSPLEVKSFRDTEVEFNVNSDEDGILYMSIPYFRGFKVYVDGEQTDIIKIGDAMMGVKMTSGEHDVHITYRAYGLYVGIIMSILGWISVVAFAIYKKLGKINR